MEYTYSVRVKVISDKPLTREQLEELFCYLELQTNDGANVRAEATYTKEVQSNGTH